ncbi:uncharacterized protein A4U43_C02F15290 [Asparagus officinalis]|uniref:Uncharacterized protein n=1 Tax=Asparagus officinalis TaxID=4686 RepID=A0A5P1FIF3_ASPOF|nr:uncharacterized protein A4U43_C02F15290 [Asparagus officinalis]
MRPEYIEPNIRAAEGTSHGSHKGGTHLFIVDNFGVKVVRLGIVQVLTVILQKQKTALRNAYKKKSSCLWISGPRKLTPLGGSCLQEEKFLPLDLRPKKTHTIRRKLTKHQKSDVGVQDLAKLVVDRNKFLISIEFPEVLHLQLRNYLYSFEFLLDDKSLRASVHRYRARETRYAHFRQTDGLLADSGWHCSLCFRYISEYVFKMKAYSHVDRVRFSYYMIPSRIQDVICKGADLFDMLPEEYTFQEIIAKLGPIPSTYSAVNSKFISELNNDAKILLQNSLMDANREREKNILK